MSALTPAWVRAVQPSVAWNGMRELYEKGRGNAAYPFQTPAADLTVHDADDAYRMMLATVLAQLAVVDDTAACELLGSLCDFAAVRGVTGIQGPFLTAYLAATCQSRRTRAEGLWVTPETAVPVVDAHTSTLRTVRPSTLTDMWPDAVDSDRPPDPVLVVRLATAVAATAELRVADPAPAVADVLRQVRRDTRSDAAARSLAQGKVVATEVCALADGLGLPVASSDVDGPFGTATNTLWHRTSAAAPAFVVTSAPVVVPSTTSPHAWSLGRLPRLTGTDVGDDGLLAPFVRNISVIGTTDPGRPAQVGRGPDGTFEPAVPSWQDQLLFQLLHPDYGLTGGDPSSGTIV